MAFHELASECPTVAWLGNTSDDIIYMWKPAFQPLAGR
jgi:hypothetical protein